ncbi:alpha/beta fold hydrolase [Catenulispora yoronensis]
MRQSVEIEFPRGADSYAVTRWAGEAPDAPVVVAAHGITANGLAWAPLAEAVPEIDLVAPDLRGRGRSRGVGGPYSMAAHADDLVRTLDHLGIEQATLLGHSMGGWVVAVAAVRHPDRFGGVVLVDGGLGFPLPPDVDMDELLDALLGPAMTKLRTVYADRDEFLAPWRNHPSLTEVYSPPSRPIWPGTSSAPRRNCARPASWRRSATTRPTSSGIPRRSARSARCRCPPCSCTPSAGCSTSRWACTRRRWWPPPSSPAPGWTCASSPAPTTIRSCSATVGSPRSPRRSGRCCSDAAPRTRPGEWTGPRGPVRCGRAQRTCPRSKYAASSGSSGGTSSGVPPSRSDSVAM